MASKFSLGEKRWSFQSSDFRRDCAEKIARWFEHFMFSTDYADDSSRERRIRFACTAVSILACAVLARVTYLQTGQHQKWLKLASRQHDTAITISGARGGIFDGAGRALALSVETLSIGVHPKKISDKVGEAERLASILSLPVDQVLAKLEQDRPFVPLARGIAKEKLQELQAPGLHGLEIEREFRRYYPQGDIARPILGQVSLAGAGQSGIEMRFDRQLNAASTKLSLRRDARGRYLSATGDQNVLSSLVSLDAMAQFSPFGELSSGAIENGEDLAIREEGGDVQLTIDSVVQSIVEEELSRGRADAKARRTIAVVMDADNGELLALGQSLNDDSKQDGFLHPDQLRSHPLQDNFEPGSTFKPLVAAIAMNRKLVRADELVNCENGRFPVGPNIIRDVHPVGTVPFSEVLVRSSNIGIAKIGARVGKEGLHRSLQEFGFGSRSGIELPGEEGGIMRSLKDWKPIDTATTSFGQGISVTALQLTRAYAVLANGGYLVKPSIIRNSPGYSPDRTPIRLLRPEIAHRVAEILVGVTEDQEGTGKQAAIKGLAVSGKTGTAQKARANGRGYETDKVFASFIGFIDASSIGVPRRIVMFVGVDEPGVTPRWGGTVAAPIFRRAMERIVSQLLMQDEPHTQTAAVEHREKLS